MRDERPSEQKTNRLSWTHVAIGAAVIALVLIVIQVVIMTWFTAAEPESIAAPDDAATSAPIEERGGVPDGGELTSVPTQAAPEEGQLQGDPATNLPEEETPEIQ